MQANETNTEVREQLTRIERQFAAQRVSLEEETVRFAEWKNDWEIRQQSIDATLQLLKSRLSRKELGLSEATLRLFS
ncbi:hypothetical protein SH668x_001967 [Planctomicrobium sp. SH668]|uniref:hypothetical protein n=1 Tax=Planctomicrobium sp. SH668 TaxID=3448126 RepID=UPI003F5BBDE8